MKIKNIFPAAIMSVAMIFTGCSNGAGAPSLPNGSSVNASSSSSDESSSSSVEIDITGGNKAQNSKGFSIDGSKLIDANGNEFIMRGVNHSYAWNTDALEDALTGIAATGANTVRVAISNGTLAEKTPKEKVEEIISKCEELKLVTVLEVHDTTYGNRYYDEEAGKELKVRDDLKVLDNAADYWIELKDILNEHKDTVIVNIGNEWHNASWSNPQEWADGYTAAIEKLRSNKIENTLMVDCDGGGQFAGCLYGDDQKKTPAFAPDIVAADKKGNTMFSIHMFESAAPDTDTINKIFDSAEALDVCFCIGSFYSGSTVGNVDSQTIMDRCQNDGVGYIGWIWKNNADDVSDADIALAMDGSEISYVWGEQIINGTNGIKETSKVCSVFE